MTRRKKNKPAPGVTILSDGRYKVRVAVTTRQGRKDATQTLPQGATLGEAIEVRDDMRARLLEGEAPRPQKAPTLGTLAAQWLESRGLRVSLKTAESYRWTLEDYMLPHLGGLRVDDVRRSDVESWAALLEASGKSLRTQQLLWGIGCMFLKDVCADYGQTDPTLRVPGPRGVAETAGRALSQKEIRSLVGHLRKEQGGSLLKTRKALAVEVLLFTGLRVGELVAMPVAGFDSELHTLTVSSGKTAAASRTVPMPEDLSTRLAAWRKEAFKAQLRGVAGSPTLFGNIGTQGVRNWVVAAGEAVKLGRVLPHDLRRTFVTQCVRAGVEGAFVRATVGHKGEKMTNLYTRASEEDTRTVVLSAWRHLDEEE